jgi:hypothetical protein
MLCATLDDPDSEEAVFVLRDSFQLDSDGAFEPGALAAAPALFVGAEYASFLDLDRVSPLPAEATLFLSKCTPFGISASLRIARVHRAAVLAAGIDAGETIAEELAAALAKAEIHVDKLNTSSLQMRRGNA